MPNDFIFLKYRLIYYLMAPCVCDQTFFIRWYWVEIGLWLKTEWVTWLWKFEKKRNLRLTQTSQLKVPPPPVSLSAVLLHFYGLLYPSIAWGYFIVTDKTYYFLLTMFMGGQRPGMAKRDESVVGDDGVWVGRVDYRESFGDSQKGLLFPASSWKIIGNDMWGKRFDLPRKGCLLWVSVFGGVELYEKQD